MNGDANQIKHRLSMGLNYLKLGENQKALNLFEQILKTDPDNIPALSGKIKVISQSETDEKKQELINNLDSILRKKAHNVVFPKHNPYQTIISFLQTTDSGESLNKNDYLYKLSPSLLRLKDAFKSPEVPDIDEEYNERELQKAYLVRYFPFYIETIYRELGALDPAQIFNEPDLQFSVCLYGCGPCPEYLGILRFVTDYLPDMNQLDVYFFEKYDWDWIRDGYTLCQKSEYSTKKSLKCNFHSYPVDVLSFDNGDILKRYQVIGAANIHVFQNCLRDLVKAASSYDSLYRLFENILEEMAYGSLLVITDLRYSKTRFFLERFITDIEKDMKGIVLKASLDNPEYRPNFYPDPEFTEFVKQNPSQRKTWSRYYSVIIMKI